MKKILLTIALFVFASTAFANHQTQAHVIKQQITVPAGSTSEPLFIPVSGNLKSIKICSSFDAPVKNVQVKGEIENVWFGSTSGDCTTLDDVGSIALEEGAELKLVCRNFDAIQRVCHVKAVYYTNNIE